MAHIPVLPNEVMEYLRPETGNRYLDCTVGAGGHSGMILERSGPAGFLVGLDRDREALSLAEENLKRFAGRFTFFHADYKDFERVFPPEYRQKFHGILADLGVSSMQLGRAERGFSFQREGPLDMRMDPSKGVTASDLIRDLPERELEKLIRLYGEERFAGRIAGTIVRERATAPIVTTLRLAGIIKDAVPVAARHGRLHPATRTFQALRIAVNRELEGLSEFILAAYEWLAPGGRLAVISFHSLEDRIVKRTFLSLVRKVKKDPKFQWTKRPVVPSLSEVSSNPASRSAKLRVIERRV